MARGSPLAYIQREFVDGRRGMSPKALQALAFLLLIVLTLYIAFGGGA